MKLNKIKKDWWLVTSISLFVSAGITIIYYSSSSTAAFVGGLIVGGIDALIGIALLQRSKIAFWIVLVTAAYNLLRFFATVKTGSTGLYSLEFFIRIVILGCVLMLWQQIRRQGKKA